MGLGWDSVCLDPGALTPALTPERSRTFYSSIKGGGFAAATRPPPAFGPASG